MSSFGEATGGRSPSMTVVPDNAHRRNAPMITQLSDATIMVLDQDEALDFYVNKLGLEVGSDFKQGDPTAG